MINFRIINPAPAGRLLFPDVIWTSGCGKMLLSIDDSPNPATTVETLKLLAKFDIKALFFCIGRNIVSDPGLLKEIAAAGHTVGNHSYSHVNLRKLSYSAQVDEIRRANAAFKQAGIENIKYFRPPYGRFNRNLLQAVKQEGMKMVLWSLLTYDYKNDLNLFKFAARKLKRNSLVIMHDSLKSKDIFAGGLSALLESAALNNIAIGSPEECLN